MSPDSRGMSRTMRRVGNTEQKAEKAEMREKVSFQNQTQGAERDETPVQCFEIETKHDG